MVSTVLLIRRKLLLRQDEFADLLLVSRQTISMYETGRSIPRFNVIKRLMKIAQDHNIEVRIEDFLTANKLPTKSVDNSVSKD